jgi:SAM-dependent methyltransferase
MSAAELVATRCAICSTEGNSNEIYPANFDLESLNPAIFSARRLPDRIHYRLVKCRSCGLVRSDPIAPAGLLARLYGQSTFTYGAEVTDLRDTYGRYLSKLDDFGVRRGALLEIGCGNGFFLQEARERGFHRVQGVEPSRAAVDQADPKVREGIVCAFMGPKLFKPEQFDVICLFQVFDHMPEPGEVLNECFRLLRPDGLILCINHNIEAVSARMLRERSPIIDIEHTYLYCPSTMARLFQNHGFEIKRLASVWNTYSLSYLARLMPFPGRIKRKLLGWLKSRWLGNLRLTVPLGNLLLVAQKPERHSPVSQ